MAYTLYNKPYQSPQQLIATLQSKNIFFSNIPAAEKILSEINYYKFKMYLHPFLDPTQPKKYYVGTKFEDALELYRFDDKLRDILFSIIGRIEIKLKTKLDRKISSFTNANSPTNDIFWYLNFDYYKSRNKKEIASLLNKLNSTFISSKEAYVEHYKSHYYNDSSDNYKLMPPFWIISELMTLGDIAKFYDFLNISKFDIHNPRSNKLEQLANEFGASSVSSLVSWVYAIRDIRNRCAHHSRLWNTIIREPGEIVLMLTHSSTFSNRIYLSLVMMHIMIKALNITGIDLKQNLLDLENEFPIFKVLNSSAGFPPNWDTDPIWN